MTQPSPVPTNPDGSPNFNTIPTAGGGSTSVPVDSTGAISVWDLPQWITDYEKKVAKPFYWDSYTEKNTVTAGKLNNPAFRRANDLPESNEPSIEKNVNVSAEQLMKQFAAMAYNDPGSFAQFQQALADGPWASDLKVTGVFDQNTEQALAGAMVQYLKTSRSAGVPVSFKDYLLQSAASNKANNPTQAKPGPVLTDPASLKMAAQQAAEAALGHTLSEAQLNAFVDKFHTGEMSAYTSSAESNGQPTVGQTDPQTAAIQYVQQADPSGFDQHKVTGFANALLNSLMSGSQPSLPVGQEIPTI